MIEARLGAAVLNEFLADVEQGAFALDFDEGDLSRVRVLITRYQDLLLLGTRTPRSSRVPNAMADVS